jgi:hypothetical protein
MTYKRQVKRRMDRRRGRKFENCKEKNNNTDELTPKRFKKNI